MDAVEFLNENERFCETQMLCDECPLLEHCYIKPDNENAVAFIEKWSAEHPQKTRLQDLKEKHPNAEILDDGTPAACCQELGYCIEDECSKHEKCIECWNTPID